MLPNFTDRKVSCTNNMPRIPKVSLKTCTPRSLPKQPCQRVDVNAHPYFIIIPSSPCLPIHCPVECLSPRSADIYIFIGEDQVSTRFSLCMLLTFCCAHIIAHTVHTCIINQQSTINKAMSEGLDLSSKWRRQKCSQVGSCQVRNVAKLEVA